MGFGLPAGIDFKQISNIMAAVGTLKDAAEFIKTADFDHDHKADLVEIVDKIKALEPLEQAVVASLKKMSFEKGHEPTLADFYAVLHEVQPVAGELTAKIQEIGALLQADYAAFNATYGTKLKGLAL